MGTNTTYRKTIPASTKNLSEIRNFVAQHATSHGFEHQQIADIRLAVDEAITNIIKHAYNGEENHTIEIEVIFKDDRVCIELFDTGTTFNLRTFPQPDIKEKIKQKKRGGMGVYLIHSLMDDVSYGREEDSNKMVMCKYRT
ncbi:ATP-binding protein [Rhodohalobacter sp. 8-1]|uniref:ATP-binding protein n=1 Tax=Rhodohalobacter sp. 8-1 TaxID=3131972 RepID=UPI0030ECCE9A